MTINHKFIGNPDAEEIIIFLHEGLGSITLWKDFPDQLCALTNRYGLVYDRSGYGLSSGDLTNRSKDYLHQAAEELENLIQTIVPSHYKIILYGHSDGGSIALIHAAKYPDRTLKVITEAAHVFVEDITIAGVKAARPLFDLGKFEGLRKYHGDRYKEVFYAWNDIWLADAFRNWDITSLLPKINCPQLIIQGVDDQYGTLKQVEAIAELTTGQTIRFTPDQCGHAPHKEQREKVLEKALDFIEE